MPGKWRADSFSLLLILALLFSLLSPAGVKPVSADPGKQTWSVIDTPNQEDNIIVTPSEVNVIVIGPDDRTVYAVDIPNGRVYKSTNWGIQWSNELSGYLTAAGANLPVWNLAVAPDDVDFLVAVTDIDGVPNGPQEVFVSEDGGSSWEKAMTGLTLPAGEYISCVDISVTYSGDTRDIAIGTRIDGVNSRVWALKTGVGSPGWNDQGFTGYDVVALKFSPSYTSDSSLVVVSSGAGGTFLNLGIRDTAVNTTDWSTWGPVELETTGPGNSPHDNEIITADLELPSDFSGADPNLRRFYVSLDADAGDAGMYRVDNTVAYHINSSIDGRISSIAYRGTYDEGVLLAGEVTAAGLAPSPSSYGVYVWRTSNPDEAVGGPTWYDSAARKSPTGGVGTGYANAQVVWSLGGTRAYCGTSSADLSVGGTAWAVNQWPNALLTGAIFDESAFSVSPYSPAYEQLLVSLDEVQDSIVGNVWNQLSLIDTQISFLSDVAALEAPEISGGLTKEYSILYLASVSENTTVGGYDSIWRSTSDPLGVTWERVFCLGTTNDDLILRVRQTLYEEEEVRSEVIVFADLDTSVVGYSENEGQAWDIGPISASVTDLAVSEDTTIFILEDTIVYRYIRSGAGWIQTNKERTSLDSGHTIAVPLKNPSRAEEGNEDWVIVGEAGPTAGFARVAWADFSDVPIEFEPSFDLRVELPVPGNVHVITDDAFQANMTIYAASHNSADTDGKIYRWVIDESTAWEELEPPNSAFYGLAQRNNVLYGAWIKDEVPAIGSDTGADRTLYPRVNVPPPPEWDYLTVGLPANVLFTREPSSLKVSSNEFNNLWAIDDRQYDWANQEGCLWGYTDMVAKFGPWTTSPASGDSVPIDPVSGRANEVNFRWRQLSYASAYELQVAKDSDFSIVVLLNEDIVPVNPLSPECFFPAGGLVPVPASGIAGWGNLESGHTYYWRVRARTAVTGEIVRSPWSATMYFTVESGLPVVAPYPTVTLFSPLYGARGVSRNPSFSWSPMPKTTKYEFVLARDAALQRIVVKAEVPLTSYQHDVELDYGTSYFWQVRAVEPVVSDPSAIGVFTVVAEEKPVGPVTEEPSPIPFWTWAVIAVCFALVASMIAFAMVKPRYASPKAAATTKMELGSGKPDGSPKATSVTKVELDTDKHQGSPKASSITELKMDIDKSPGLLSRIWGSMKAGIGRLRYLGKRGGGGSGESTE